MTRAVTVTVLSVLALSASARIPDQTASAAQGARNLEIYWIDVEGGAATLFVSPTGDSLLFDTGYPGNGDRDAKRILAAAQKAGLKRIDHIVISHWHGDHVGGLEALSKMIPLGRFYDHGNGVEQVDQQRLDGYKTVAGTKRTIVNAGDTIPLGGVQMRVVVSEGPVIAKPMQGPPIQALQHLLRHRGSTITADGIFGPKTEAAVKAFQQSRGLVVDGKAGPQTWPKLIVTVRRGDSSEAVRGAQCLCVDVTVDGVFGPKTEAGVKAMQGFLCLLYTSPSPRDRQKSRMPSSA